MIINAVVFTKVIPKIDTRRFCEPKQPIKPLIAEFRLRWQQLKGVKLRNFYTHRIGESPSNPTQMRVKAMNHAITMGIFGI